MPKSNEDNVLDLRQISPLLDYLLEVYTGKPEYERQMLLGQVMYYWAAVETRLLQYPDISVRQAFLIMSEVIVEEWRKTYADLAMRSKFVESGDEIQGTRTFLEEVYSAGEEEDIQSKVERSAARLRTGAEVHDLVEIDG